MLLELRLAQIHERVPAVLVPVRVLESARTQDSEQEQELSPKLSPEPEQEQEQGPSEVHPQRPWP